MSMLLTRAVGTAARGGAIRSMGTATTQLPTRPLGRTGYDVTEISLGGAGYGAVEAGQIYGGVATETALGCIHRAIERGVNFFDVAPLYAEGEIRLGLALKELSSAQRDRLVISTKVGDECSPYSDNGGHHALSADGVLASFDNSLKVLHTDRVELLLLHDPTPAELTAFLAPGGGIEAMVQLKREGAIGAIGLGCVELAHHLEFMEHPAAEAILTVNDYNLVRRRVADTVLPSALDRQVGMINAGVFYMGLVGGLPPAESFSMGFKSSLAVDDLVGLATRIWNWCEFRGGGGVDVPAGQTIRQAALEFGLDHPAVATCLMGCRTPDEIDQVLDVYQLPKLDEAFWTDFDAEFGAEIASFPLDKHWYYSKEMDIGN